MIFEERSMWVRLAPLGVFFLLYVAFNAFSYAYGSSLSFVGDLKKRIGDAVFFNSMNVIGCDVQKDSISIIGNKKMWFFSALDSVDFLEEYSGCDLYFYRAAIDSQAVEISSMAFDGDSIHCIGSKKSVYGLVVPPLDLEDHILDILKTTNAVQIYSPCFFVPDQKIDVLTSRSVIVDSLGCLILVGGVDSIPNFTNNISLFKFFLAEDGCIKEEFLLEYLKFVLKNYDFFDFQATYNCCYPFASSDSKKIELEFQFYSSSVDQSFWGKIDYLVVSELGQEYVLSSLKDQTESVCGMYRIFTHSYIRLFSKNK